MKIDNKTPEAQGPGKAGYQQAQKVKNAAPAAPAQKPAEVRKAAPADTVDISGKSRQAAEISAAVQQLPEVREAKVQELKRSVESGAYQIDARKIAESILKDL